MADMSERSDAWTADDGAGGFSDGPDTSDIATPNDDDIFEYHLLCLGTSWWELPQI
jgi:hypothetical protein